MHNISFSKRPRSTAGAFSWSELICTLFYLVRRAIEMQPFSKVR